MKESIDIHWGLLGAELALEDDDVQAEFFKGLIGGLQEYASEYHRQLQFFNVRDKLDPKSRKLLECLSCLWYAEGE